MATKSRLLSRLIEGDGSIKTTQIDSDAIGTSAAKSITAASGTTIYSSADTLPVSAAAGDQAFVSSTNRLYISNGSGWYNIALINNTPYWITEADGSYTLSTTGDVTTITILAQDSDGINVVYTAVTDSDFDNIATVTKDSDNGRTFTITPTDSENGTAVAGTGTVTFRASDGVNLVSTLSTFSLTFITVIENSAETRLLVKADAVSTDNQVDASTNTHTITENGNVTSTAFTPYHPGGYSTYFDGTGDYLVPDITTAVGTSDFTLEGWFYPTSTAVDTTIFDFRSSGNWGIFSILANNTVAYYNGSSSVGTTSNTVTDNTWNHIAIVRNSGSIKIYINGVLGSTTADTTNWTLAASPRIGGNKGNVAWMNGYIADVRFVSGTAVYTSAFTPPTERLTAIANTSLLTCHTPYIADGSTNSHAITIVGNTSTKRFGPYDHRPYTKADHGGSVYFDGVSGTKLTIPVSASLQKQAGGDFTFEAWIYPTARTSYDMIVTCGDQGVDFGYTFFWHNTSYHLMFEAGTSGWSSTPYTSSSNDGIIQLNEWQHVAFMYSGGNLTLFRNGKVALYQASAQLPQIATSGLFALGGYMDGGVQHPFKGYMANARVTQSAVYTSNTNFTPPTAPLTAITNTQLLTCTNKNDIWDASSGGLIVENGTVTASNTQRKFSTSSAIYHSGGAQNLEYYPETSAVNIGTRDFTVEFWLRADTTSGTQAIATPAAGAGFTTGNDKQSFWIGILGSGSYWLVQSGPNWDTVVQGSNDVLANTWQHWAMSRNNGTVRYFIDGTLVGSRVNSTSFTNTNGIISLLGRSQGSQHWGGGYMQDFNYTLGLGRYTANFTPPTAEFDG